MVVEVMSSYPAGLITYANLSRKAAANNLWNGEHCSADQIFSQ